MEATQLMQKTLKGDTSNRDTSRSKATLLAGNPAGQAEINRSIASRAVAPEAQKKTASGQSLKQSTINSNTSIREPPKATSTQGVRMFQKDYSSFGAQTATRTKSSGGVAHRSQLRNSTALTSANQIKSLESVIRRSTIKSIEPLRKRTNTQTSTSQAI